MEIAKPNNKSTRKEMLAYAKQEGHKGYSKMTKTELADLLNIKGAVKGARKGKKEKDENKPKRAKTGYIFFCQDKRNEVKKKNPNASFGEIGSALGKMWRELGEKEKAKYLKKNEDDKKRYEQEIENYQPPKKEEAEGEEEEEEEVKKPSPAKAKKQKKAKKPSPAKAKDEEEEYSTSEEEDAEEPEPSPSPIVKKRGGGRKKKN